MNEQQIIELLRSGDFSKASQKLYAYYPVIKKMILKNQGSNQDAEDVYQDALLIILRKIADPEFNLTSNLSTYMYSVCRFLWSDELKKRNKRFEVEIKEASIYSNEELGINAEQIRSEKLAEKAFTAIGEKCKELLKLFYYSKNSLKEIASKLNFANEKVAKNQKYRCIEKAKENLKTLMAKDHE